MRLRKQSKSTAKPGDEFLRAVSSGPPRRQAPARSGTPEDYDELRQRLLESERQGAAADEALRQIREDGDDRLEQARHALAQEREARLAAERRLAEVARGPGRAAASATEPEDPDGQPEPAPGFTDRQEGWAPDEVAPEVDWPTPWLGGQASPKRGLFRRSRS